MGVPSLICRGKNLHLAVMKQFLYALPKQDMSKDKFYEYAEERMPGFATTHSQIARQMGLYYCDADDVCHIRFNYEPTLIELLQYSKFWAEHYFVPNPYTPSFPASAEPTCIYGFIRSNCTSPNYDKVFDKLLEGMFNCALNEGDKAKAYLLQFTDMIDIGDGRIGFASSDSPASVRANVGRNDIEGYFHYFDKWREAQKKPEDNKPEPPPNVDRLSIALKIFAEKRAVLLAVGEKNYDECYAECRAEAAKIDGDYLVQCDYVAFRKTLNDKQVANVFFSKHTDDDKRCLGDFMAAARRTPQDISFYLKPENKPNVPGVGPAMLTAFLTRTHPDLFAFYTEQMFESVKFLGLTADAALPPITTDAYNTYKGIQTAIRDRMREMGIKAENGNDADYLTVNEFTWFVSENKDLIKEEVMNKAMKTDKPTPYEGKKDLELRPESKDDELLLRLLASLRAKPFAILAGHSGTGKSRYVKKLAYMTCNVKGLRNENQLPGNYLLLQVKPNWHDSTDLLGFRNAMAKGAYQKTQLIEFIFKAYHFSETPFFLCLDEMNLAPVEQYFAEFLSAMESKEPVPLNDISEKDDNLPELGCEWADSLEYLKNNGFSIPNNLFIVGTVNMDETTNQFSRKVLDRAFTIEMTDVDFTNYGNVTEPSYDDTLKPDVIESLLNGEKAVKELDGDDTKEDSSLVKVQKALASTPFAIAYRFANEYTLLKRAIECFDADGKMKLDALDQAVLMKILPRIAGERDYIEKVYGEKENEGLRGALEGKQVSLSKISEILKRATDTNSLHITFWP